MWLAGIEMGRLGSGEVCGNPLRNERNVVSLKVINLAIDPTLGWISALRGWIERGTCCLLRV